MLGDLRNPKLLWLKGGLFVVLALGGAALLLLEAPTLRVAVLLAMTVWAACRAYYFAFYVIEHYVDPGQRYAGLLDFARYALRRRRGR